MSYDLMADRMVMVLDRLHEVEDFYTKNIRPIEQFILARQSDSTLARRIAWGIVLEARKVDMPIDLAMGILLVENPDFDPKAKSFVGAVGLAQVMPLHRGRWAPCGDNLYSVEDNLCTGFRIFLSNLEYYGGDLDRALLAYNGCVRGTNTPNCFEYPQWVKSRMARARREIWNTNALSVRSQSSRERTTAPIANPSSCR